MVLQIQVNEFKINLLFMFHIWWNKTKCYSETKSQSHPCKS